jgi:HNH endonuclease
MEDHREQRTDAVPVGYCQCGCGQRTNLAPRNHSAKGWVKGQPLCRVKGHGARKRVRYIEMSSGFETPCHLWQLAKNHNGYGQVSTPAGMALAHRVYYEERYGPVPEGTELDHLCRVRACVNPEHLEPVSHAENCRRGQRAKLTPDQVAEIRSSCETQHVIARRFGITQGQVARIRKGQCW